LAGRPAAAPGYKLPPLGYSLPHTQTLSSLMLPNFEILPRSVVIPLVEVLQKIGKSKTINGRSSAEILLRENYWKLERLTPRRLTLGQLTIDYFIS
jgi:hypothetical protein